MKILKKKRRNMGLYILIWGEASNVWFMPECLCYIFHNVSTNIAHVSLYLVPQCLCNWNIMVFSLIFLNLLVICTFSNNGQVWHQMAYELHGLLAGNVSIVTGENIKPSYGGDDKAFLRKVIIPLYRVIAKVWFYLSWALL